MFNALCPAVYKQLRLRAGMTQVQLANALDVSRMTVMRFENGRSRPEKRQEEKLKELAKCSDEQFVELVCELLSAEIDRPVGILEGDGAYRPTTALAEAYALLHGHGADLRPEQTRALQLKISLTQFLEMAFAKNTAGLVELTKSCRDQLEQRQEGAAC